MIAAVVLGVALASGSESARATYSIVAFDPETGDLGVAVQSRFFAVGDWVPFAEAGSGAIATQALANVGYGPDGLAMLRAGRTAPAVVAALVRDDPLRERRQLGIVDAEGRVAVHTGTQCLPWAGSRLGKHFAVLGNLLSGSRALDDMAAAYEAAGGDLAARLLRALVAGQAAGGDVRGMQSAALVVVRAGSGHFGLTDRYIDLQVQDHEDPIGELGRLLGIRHAQLELDAAERTLAAALRADAGTRPALLEVTLATTRHALALDPRNDYAWWFVARLELARGGREAAAMAARQALLVNPAWARMPPETRTALGVPDELLAEVLEVPDLRILWDNLSAPSPSR